MSVVKYIKKNKLNELIGVLAFSITIVLLVSIYSFNTMDPPNVTGVTDDYSYKNYMGVIGSYISYAIFFIFGKGSYLIPFIFFAWGYYELKEGDIKEHTIIKMTGIFILIIAICGTFGVPGFVLKDFSLNKFTPGDLIKDGGLIGYFIVFLVPYLGYGIHLLLFALYLTGIILLTKLSFNKTVSVIWKNTVRIIKLIIVFINYTAKKVFGIITVFSLAVKRQLTAMYSSIKNKVADYKDRYDKERIQKKVDRSKTKLENTLEEKKMSSAESEDKKTGDVINELEKSANEPSVKQEEGIEETAVAENNYSIEKKDTVLEEDFASEEDIIKDKAVVNEKDDKELSFKEQKQKLEEEAKRKRIEYEKRRNMPYELPPIPLLSRPKNDMRISEDETREIIEKLENTFAAFKIDAKVVKYNVGPAVTMYEVLPAAGVAVHKIVQRQDDIKLRLAAKSIRIVAPIPGKAAVGIEVPRKNPSIVTVREIVESEKFGESKKPLKMAIGKDILGQPIIGDLAKMPHMLIAGATGSGKSVCINSIISSLIMKNKPDDLKLLLIDPKMVELKVYKDLPHLMSPVVTDMKKAAQSLQWAAEEMQERYNKLAKIGARNIEKYNHDCEDHERLPYLVIIVDELSDLMALARKECEGVISRLAAMARAVGIHVILATQRPSVDVVTGLIKANFPSRIAFQVPSIVDSKTIIDGKGAEVLLGNGDMLYKPQNFPKPIRVQGAFLTDSEIEKVVDFITSQRTYESDYDIFNSVDVKQDRISSEDITDDELLNEAKKIVVLSGQGSIAMLQRILKVGHNRAANLMKMLEELGIVGPSMGPQPREVYIDKDEYIAEHGLEPEDEMYLSV